VSTGGSNSGSPLKIAAGYFGGAGSTTAQGHSECPAGYFCPVGTADKVCVGTADKSNCRKRCGYGETASKKEAYFCPARSATRTAVDPGYYAAGIGDPDHEEETRDQQKKCKPPNYCPGGGPLVAGETCPGTKGQVPPCRTGLEEACPAGTFGSSDQLSDPACDGPCAPGFFCTEGE